MADMVDMAQMYPPPPKRRCPANQMPVYKNGNICIPREDAQLMEMIISDKASLNSQLDVTKKAMVGLDFVTEYIDPDAVSPRVYNCTLCMTFRTVNTIMDHLTGYNHRVNYIRKQFPNECRQYLLPDGTTKNRNGALMTIASKRCQELELVYGRGDYEIKTEKVKIPEGELDAPERDFVVEGKTTETLRNMSSAILRTTLETDEDVKIAKSMINALTNLVCAFKYGEDNKN